MVKNKAEVRLLDTLHNKFISSYMTPKLCSLKWLKNKSDVYQTVAFWVVNHVTFLVNTTVSHEHVASTFRAYMPQSQLLPLTYTPPLSFTEYRLLTNQYL